jgi:hypothetical protein
MKSYLKHVTSVNLINECSFKAYIIAASIKVSSKVSSQQLMAKRNYTYHIRGAKFK